MGQEAQGPGGSWEGTEDWSFLMGEKHGQLALTVTSCTGGLLVTISLWTFNIAQIPLHMWHFCFCVMCSSGSICFSLSLSLSPGLRVGLWPQPSCQRLRCPPGSGPACVALGAYRAPLRWQIRKPRPHLQCEPGTDSDSFKDTDLPLVSPLNKWSV